MSDTREREARPEEIEIAEGTRKHWTAPTLSVARVAQVTSTGTAFGNEGSGTYAYS